MEIIKKINEIAIKLFDNNNSKFAASVGTSETNIRNYRGKIVPKVDFIIRLCNEYDISLDWMFNNKGPMHASKVEIVPVTAVQSPPINLVQGNEGIPVYEMDAKTSLVSVLRADAKITGYITIPGLPESDGALHVKGDNMSPVLNSGDLVLYKRVKSLENGIYYGEIYLLSIDIEGDEATLIRYVQLSERGNNHIRLASHNPHYSPKDLELKYVKAMALVKTSIRTHTMM